MRIAQIVPSLLNSGPVIVAKTLTEELTEKGHIVDTYYFDDIKGLDFPGNVRKIDMNVSIEFDNYDIIHSHGFRPDKYTHKYRNSITRAKTVSTIHQNIYTDSLLRRGFFVAVAGNILWKHYLSSKDAIIPISKYLYSYYKNDFKNIAHHVYNGVRVDYDPSKQKEDLRQQILSMKEKGLKVTGLYAGINKIKGIEQIINLLGEREDLSVIIIGDGREVENLKDLARPVSDRVVFYPRVLQPYNYLENIDVFLMLSRNEGFGMSTIEAIASETPVVCSDISVMRELFQEDEVSFFKLDDKSSLSLAIDRSILNGEELKRNAKRKYEENFTSKSMCERYLRVYEQVLAEK